jgi:hypothetical protein
MGRIGTKVVAIVAVLFALINDASGEKRPAPISQREACQPLDYSNHFIFQPVGL